MNNFRSWKKIYIHQVSCRVNNNLKNNIGPSNPFITARSISLARAKFITEFRMLHEKLVIILFITVYVGHTISPTKLSNMFTNMMLRACYVKVTNMKKNNMSHIYRAYVVARLLFKMKLVFHARNNKILPNL